MNGLLESRVVKLEIERDITKLEDSLSEGDRKLKELDNEIQQFEKAIEQKEIIICETKTVFKNLKWYLFRLILILSY